MADDDFYMVPGGNDIVIDAVDPLLRRPEVIDFVRKTWSAAVIEDAETGGPLTKATTEILAYRDAAAFISWQECGATDKNGDDMLHILFDDDSITCVVDGPDTAAMAEQIRAIATATT